MVSAPLRRRCARIRRVWSPRPRLAARTTLVPDSSLSTFCCRAASKLWGHPSSRNVLHLVFDRVSAAWDNLVSGATMNFQRITLAVVLTGVAGAAAMAQSPSDQQPVDPKTTFSTKDTARSDAYYNFTMGHIYEQQYENTSNAEYATKAIEAYKKAYALDPKSPVIGERLAEMYWKAQRIHDAVTEAQEILKRDPDNLQSRRLLGTHLSSQSR